MIDFALGDELELVRATARDFATDQLRGALRDHETERKLATDVHQRFAEIGFATLEWPEALGGSDLGALARCVITEELSAGCPGAALALDGLGPALYPLLELGGNTALEDFALPLLATPGARALLVWTGSGSRAQVGESGGKVSGQVPWVPADRVDLLVGLDETGAWVISEGIATTRVPGAGLRAAGASSLQIEDAPLRAHWREPAAAGRALARARLYNAALLVGVMREAAEFSRDYAQQRTAFGRPIAHHQALAFLIADMAAAVDSARLLLWDAALAVDARESAEERCASAFLEASEQALFVTPNALQILGGHGFMQDYPVEKSMREARTLSLSWGGVDAARECAGREILEHTQPLALLAEGG